MALSRSRAWRLLALVAILSVLLVAEQIKRQTPDYSHIRDMAKAHASSEANYRKMRQTCVHQARALRDTDPAASIRLQESAARYAELAAYHAQLREKYEAVVPYPGFTIPPDPPPPK